MTDLDHYLSSNPAMTVRDWKGKGFTIHAPFDKHYVGPNEKPWGKLNRDEVRRLATSEKARFLPRSYRMAAARDPGLIWDERTLAYRLRAEATPAPQETSGGVASREGASKVPKVPQSRPAAATNLNANPIFPEGDDA